MKFGGEESSHRLVTWSFRKEFDRAVEISFFVGV